MALLGDATPTTNRQRCRRQYNHINLLWLGVWILGRSYVHHLPLTFVDEFPTLSSNQAWDPFSRTFSTRREGR
jgi:hypothetical protein